MTDLEELADACIFPGFDGTSAPDWIRRRIAGGLRGVVLYHANMAGLDALADLTATLRSERSDLIIGIDEEGGDVTRLYLDRGSPWPGNLALGRADDLQLTRDTAASIGRRLAEVGVNLDLAPVVDVNTVDANPVIGTRSFGSDPARVAAHSRAYVEGLQSVGIAGCAKHFPGHGGTTVDSHHDLPIVAEGREEFEAVAFPPFRAAIEAGVAAVMTAHIRLPAYDRVPATMSAELLTGMLRGRLGFDGAVITDSLEMHSVHDRYGIAGTAIAAIVAGADALCVGTHRGEARTGMLREELVAAVHRGDLPTERLADAARRVDVLTRRASRSRCAGDTPKEHDSAAVVAARRALLAEGVRRLTAPPLVVEFDDEPTPAIGAAWRGLGSILADRLPGTDVVHHGPASAVLRPPTGRPIVAVVRDAHRHAWVRTALDALLASRPDTTVIEMGVPSYRPPDGIAFIATFSASRVSAEAVAALLIETDD